MTRISRAVLASLAAFSMLTLVPGTVFAAQPSCGDTLMVDTTLTADLDCSAIDSDGLILGKDGIVLNLNGFTIWGFTGSDDNRGAYAIGVNHTKVRNGTIRDFQVGYEVEYGADNVVRNVHFIGEAGAADEGVYDYYSAHTVVDNVEVDDYPTGMYFEYSAGGVVMNSDVAGAADESYYLDGTTRMLLTGNSAAPASGGTGFYEDNSGGNRYLGNSSTGGEFGFDMECGGYGRVILRNNMVSGASNVGILLAECYNMRNDLGSIVTGNTSNSNGSYGFQDYQSYNATWLNNVAKFNQSSGFYFDQPGGAIIKFNVGSRNDDDGFEFHNNYNGDGDSNVRAFSYNTAKRNDEDGFDASEYPIPGTGNVARLNGEQNCVAVSCVP